MIFIDARDTLKRRDCTLRLIPPASSLGIGVVEMRLAASASTIAGVHRRVWRRRRTIQMNTLMRSVPARRIAKLAPNT